MTIHEHLAIGAILALAFCLRCKPAPEPRPPEPTGACSSACATLDRLGCPEGAPTADGVTCADLCTAERMGDQYELGCVASLEACELDSCELRP